MNNPMQSQIDGFRQQAAASGFSGNAILDVHPETGIIRLKLNTVPPDNMGQFTGNLAQAVGMMLQGMNVSVKMRVSKGE